jgi:hypothetical protein
MFASEILDIALEEKDIKKTPEMFLGLSVVWAGIEPATQGFSVLCSTD